MSFFNDYVADGLCCQVCGAYIDGDEPGFPRTCDDCIKEKEQRIKQQEQQKNSMKKIDKLKKVLEKYNISYELKNVDTGHFHTRRKFDNQLIEYYIWTGKISKLGKIQKARGEKALLQILLGKEVLTNENTSK